MIDFVFDPLNLDYFHVNKSMFEIINSITFGLIIETFLNKYYEYYPDNLAEQIYELYVPEENDDYNLDWLDEEGFHNLENILEI